MDLYSDRGKVFETLARIEAEGMALFKMGKVALNVPTAFRNVLSNLLQNNLRGRPLAAIPGDWAAALKSMKAKDQYYEEAFGHGIFKTNWFTTGNQRRSGRIQKGRGRQLFQDFVGREEGGAALTERLMTSASTRNLSADAEVRKAR